MNDLLCAVDVLDLEPDHLASTQTAAIAEAEQDAHLEATRANSLSLQTQIAAPRATLEAEVKTLCENILQAPAIATEGVKDYLRDALTIDAPAAIDYARNLHAVVNSSREIRPKR